MASGDKDKVDLFSEFFASIFADQSGSEYIIAKQLFGVEKFIKVKCWSTFSMNGMFATNF